MAELADVQDLGSCVERRAGSTPVTRTITKLAKKASIAFRQALLYLDAKVKEDLRWGFTQESKD